MKMSKRILSIVMAIVTLVSIVSISAEALTINVEDRKYGYMIPVNNKGTEVLSTVKLYGSYDYINFYIHSGFAGDVYFFYEIYSDSKLTNCIDSGYTVRYHGDYNVSQKIKLKGNYKSKTYYAVTYAGMFSSNKEKLTVDENSLCQFKIVVDRSPSYDEKKVPLKSVTNTINGPKITWSTISGTSKYYIYRRNVGSTKMTKIGAVSGEKSSFVDTAVKRKDGNYIYTVKGINSKGTASRYHYNGLTCLYAEAPTINTASVVEENAIYLEWKKTYSGAKYYIYRKEADGEWERVEDYYANYYTDEYIENGKEYSYRVKALIDHDDLGNAKSAYSVETGIIKFLSAPVMNELEIKENSIGVSWNPVEFATGYSILRKPLDSDAEWTVLATVSGEETYYEDTTATIENGAYLYTVRSEGEGFSGSYSSGKEYVDFAQPEFTVNVDADGIHMKWDKVPFATGYRILEQNDDGKWEIKTRVKKTYYDFEPSSYYNKKLSVQATRSSGVSEYKKDVQPTRYFPQITPQFKELDTYTELTWINTRADTYRVYRKPQGAENSAYELFFESTTTGFSNYNPEEDVAYTYQVRGVYGDVEQYNNFVSKTHTRYSPETCIESFKVYKEVDVVNRKYKGSDKEKIYYQYEVNKTEAFKKATAKVYYWGKAYGGDGWGQVSGPYYVANYEDAYDLITPARFCCVVSTTKGNSTPLGVNIITVEEDACETPEVKLTPTSKGFKMTWDAVEDAVAYDVYVDFPKKTDYSKTIKADGSESYCIYFNDIDYNRDLEINISAVHKNGNLTTRRIESYEVSKAPKLFAAAVRDDGVKVVWDGGYGSYAVLRKAEGESKWTCISKKYYDGRNCITINGTEYTGSSYTDTTAKKGVKYTYTVRRYDTDTKEYISYYDTKGVSAKR